MIDFITNEQIEENKNKFLQLLAQINIPEADTQGLADYLLQGDFFEAPASTQYHCNFKGGLCQHSLNVYYTLVDLTNKYFPGRYDNNSLLIVGLLHDISKTNFYEIYSQNKKIYNEHGSKHDNKGKFDWFTEDAYKIKEAEERFIAGEHGFNSMLLVSKYIPLTLEENLSLNHHHCGFGEANQCRDLSPIINKYPLVGLIHTADFISCYMLERECIV